MFKQWVKTGLYGAAGTIRSIDYEWTVENVKPTLDKFGELTEDASLSDEDAAIICRDLAGVSGVPEGLKKLLNGAAWILDNPWFNFELPLSKYRPIYEDLKHWWSDGKFTTQEFGSWIEKIADTITA